MTKWYYVSHDYFALVQKAFVELLQKNLLKPGRPGHLSKRWTPDQDEYAYNKCYKNESGFIVGDKVLVNNLEVFDLLQSKDGVTYIYHVKDGFSQTTRDACSQLNNSAKFIRHGLQGGPEDKIGELYEGILGSKLYETEDPTPEYMKSLATFKSIFLNNQCVFVYAMRVRETDPAGEESSGTSFRNEKERKAHRSLELEQNLKFVLSEAELSDILSKEENDVRNSIAKSMAIQESDLAIKIMEALKDNEYFYPNAVNSDGKEFAVTSKFQNSKLNSFESNMEKYFKGENKTETSKNIKQLYLLLSPYRSFLTPSSQKWKS